VSATVPVPPRGLQGSHGLRLVYSSATGLGFESIPNLALPPESGTVLTDRTGYSFASHRFHQYLAQEAPGVGQGVFGQLGLSDGNPDPVGGSAILGPGGNAPFLDRNEDHRGVAGSDHDVGDLLEDGLAAIGSGLRDKHGLEAFHEAKLTREPAPRGRPPDRPPGRAGNRHGRFRQPAGKPRVPRNRHALRAGPDGTAARGRSIPRGAACPFHAPGDRAALHCRFWGRVACENDILPAPWTSFF